MSVTATAPIQNAGFFRRWRQARCFWPSMTRLAGAAAVCDCAVTA
jgi:hypothetical protein